MVDTHKWILGVMLLGFIVLHVGIVNSDVSSEPVVAVYYYVWYGSDGRHWSDSNDTLVLFGDMPVIGFYSSMNTSVIEWQLGLIEDAGIDVLFVSWWGPRSYEDHAAQKLFSIISNGNYSVKAAILVEPYLHTERSDWYNESFWSITLDYIMENYVEKYPNVYFRLNGKPLVLAFNPIGMTYKPNDNRFEIRIVGNDVDNAGYQDWDLWPDYLAPWVTLKDVELRVRRDGYVALTPRFDDRLFCIYSNRTGCDDRLVDPTYVAQAYIKQWEWVIEHKNEVKIIAIYSWNEYHERSMIEPHYDATAEIPGYTPYTIYNITKHYIQLLKKTGETSPPSNTTTSWLAVDVGKILFFIAALSFITYYLFEIRHRKNFKTVVIGTIRSFYVEAKHVLEKLKSITKKK
ncbi:hypothetical protein J4526_06460 [Desulfurococcaceae archaeon MEX13E-LK6-19]|nr:hypothetical protein J4526_06460 [Desulfurococcaceae archaeon MEX13E-LK6-19]